MDLSLPNGRIVKIDKILNIKINFKIKQNKNNPKLFAITI